MKTVFKVVMLLIITKSSFSQTDQIPAEEMRLKLNPDGSHYLKLTFLNQVWLRYNESNPGTLVQNKPASETFDIGLRRTRLQFFGQVTDHVFFYTQFGQNNFNSLSQNAGNRKLQAFFHDALGEYKVWKDNDRLKLGAGLTITNGLSRFSQPSVSSIMTMDVPVFAQATVDQTDEFSRKLSVYARGQLGKFDYRVVLSDPFPITTSGQNVSTVTQFASFSRIGNHKQYQALFIYNFFDKENHTTPYMTGTYLGKKKILNLEAGVITQNDATETGNTNPFNGEVTDRIFHNMTLWSAAIFYDAPLNAEKETALSAYAGYNHLDYGPGYLRYNGIMNPGNAVTISTPGATGGNWGNAFPMFGTGKVVYAQAGYLFKKELLGKEKGTLMPYAAVMSAEFARISEQMNVFNIGINWLIKSHTSKLTLDYQLRPVYEPEGETLERTDTKGQVVLQYQVYF